MGVVSGDTRVLIDQFEDGNVDIQDLSTIGMESPPGANGTFAGILAELTFKAESALDGNSVDHVEAHSYADAAVGAVSGFTRIRQITHKLERGTRTGTIVSHFQRGNDVVVVTITAENGNVVRVHRR